MKAIILILATVLMCLSPGLYAVPDAEIPISSTETAIQDSLSIAREKMIASEYGFKDTNLLREVASILEIEDVDSWKRELNLEVRNTQLDGKTLRQLGISPYKALLALQSSKYGINELNTVFETSAKLNIPVKKLKELMGLNPLDRSTDNASLQRLEKTPLEMIELKQVFDANRIQYGSSITLVGMLVVFLSLALSSIIISQLVHLNATPKPKVIKLGKDGSIKKAPDGLNRNIVVAAITALHLHVHTIEERRRLLLTFKRTPQNLWRTSGMHEMPNRNLNRKRS